MNKITTTIIAIVVIATAATTIVAGFTVQQPAYAQLVKDPGASFFAPGEEPQIPGWDPGLAEEDAPGHCGLKCSQDSAPGTEALKAGIVGPDIPKK